MDAAQSRCRDGRASRAKSLRESGAEVKVLISLCGWDMKLGHRDLGHCF